MKKEMLFFNAIDEEELTGKTNGISQIHFAPELSKDINWFDQFTVLYPPNGVWMDLRLNNITCYDGEIAFKLKKKCKLTDYVKFSPMIHGCHIVSGKMKKVIEEFKMEVLLFKPIKIYSHNSEFMTDDYYLWQIPIIGFDKFCWRNTFFYEHIQHVTVDFKGYDLFYINNEEEYYEKKIYLYSCGAISFKEEYNFDFISTIVGDLISKDLFNKLIENGLSNIDASPFMQNINKVQTYEDFKKIEKEFKFG